MDDLRDLPDEDFDLSQDENETLDELFPEKKTRKSKKGSEATPWKFLGEVTLLFALLLAAFTLRSRIPFVSGMLENKYSAFGIFSLVFFILMFLLNRYLK